MPTYTLDELVTEIASCGTMANRGDVIRILADLGTSIDALDALVSREQLNNNSSIITTVGTVKTQFDISEVTTTETPSGSLVGDTIVAEYTGLYRINFDVGAPTTTGIGIYVTLQIEKNVSTPLYDETAYDDGVNTTEITGEIYRRLTIGDAVKFYLTTQNAVTNAGGTFIVEYLGI